MDRRLKADLLFLIPFTFCWFMLLWIFQFNVFFVIVITPIMSLSYMGFLQLLKNHRDFPYYKSIMATLSVIAIVFIIINIFMITHPLQFSQILQQLTGH